MSIRESISRNWLQKFISLAIAVGCFIFVRGLLVQELHVTVRLRVANRPGYLMSVSKLDETLTVTVRGAKSQLDTVDGTKISATVDMRDAAPGINEFPLILHYPGFSDDLQLTTSVRSLKVQLDYAVERMLPIIPVLTGKPAKGYLILRTNIEPALLLVRGPAMILSNLNTLSTVPFSISGLTTPVSVPLTIDRGNLNLDLQRGDQVTLRLQIANGQREQEFEALVPKLEGLAPHLRLVQPASLPEVRVTLIGDVGTLEQLKAEEISLLLPVSNLAAGVHNVRIVPNLPAGVHLQKIEPESISIEISEDN